MTWRWMIRESSEEFREWLEGLEQTESQRESFCRAVRLARFLAISNQRDRPDRAAALGKSEPPPGFLVPP